MSTADLTRETAEGRAIRPASRRAIGYVRVSRVNGRGGSSFISPEVQRATIEALAKARGLRIVEWFEDLDQSGGKYERPGFQAALAKVGRGEAEVFMVAKLTRFARSILDTHRALAALAESGASLVAGDIDIDTSTPTGKLVLSIFAALAEFELDLFRENWSVARAVACGKGKFPGSLPIGYRRDESGVVEVDLETAPGVVAAFLGRAQGLPYRVLAEQFEAETGRAIHPDSLDRLTSNRAYLGKLTNGTLELAVTPLVTPAQFSAANAARAPRKARTPQGSLLGGVLRCGSCGRPMSFRGGKERQYTCSRVSAGSRCMRPVLVKADLVDPYVEEAFLARHGAAGAVGTATEEREVIEAEADLAALVADLDATLALDLGHGAAAESRKRAIAEKSAKVEAAEERLEELRANSNLDTRLERVAERWPDLTLDERRRLIAAAAERITIQPTPNRGARVPISERAEIVWRGAR